MVQEAEQRRAQVAAEVRALEEQVAQIQGVIDSFLDNQLQTLRGSLGVAGQGVAGQDPRGTTGAPGAQPPPRRRGAEPVRERPRRGVAPAGWRRHSRRVARASAGGAPSAGAGPEDDSAPPPGGTERTAVVITGVPHFSRARALWQAIQEVPGVYEAKAIGYQRGVLALEVQHDPALNLVDPIASVEGFHAVVKAAQAVAVGVSPDSAGRRRVGWTDA